MLQQVPALLQQDREVFNRQVSAVFRWLVDKR